MNLIQAQTRTPKHFIIRKEQTPRSYSSYILDYQLEIISRNKKEIYYTISRKLGNINELPLPGSLEETLERPEEFFDLIVRPDQIHNLNYRLNPIDINYKTNKGHILKLPCKTKDKIGFIDRKMSFQSLNLLSYRNFNKQSGKSVYCSNKESILAKYSVIQYDLNKNECNAKSSRNLDTIKEFSNKKQERSFKVFYNTQEQWNNCLNFTCQKLGRNPNNSIISKSDSYRQKIEKRNKLEVKTPIIGRYEMKGWFLGLRDYSEEENMKHHILPIGRGTTGLWMRLMEYSKGQQTIIRSSLNKIVNAKNEYKKDQLAEIIVKPQFNNQVIGKSEFEIEVEGIKNCKHNNLMVINYQEKNNDVNIII